MEAWETVLINYQEDTDRQNFHKVLRNAENVLPEDLASFEIEWFLASLLEEPVHLLEVVDAKRADSEWDSCVRDALKLLSDLVSRHDAAEKYYDRIVEICLLHYEPLVRQHAIQCLTQVARRSVAGARDLERHVSALADTATCRAPLAVLVGTICEHHPACVADEASRIWRVYLNILHCTKSTVTIKKAALEGVSGLFKHFGSELPTMELPILYDELVNCMELSRCEGVCLKFLENYAHLFRERISSDMRVRTLAWNCDAVSARPAIIALYGAVADTLRDVSAIQRILETEVHPRVLSPRFYSRFTALRVLAAARWHGVPVDTRAQEDVLPVEYDIRNGNVNYETCEAVGWSVQGRVPCSERLLHAAILFYDNFPANKRKEVVVHSLLLAEPDLRTAATNTLIAQSIQPGGLEQCDALWRDIFDSGDPIALQHSRHVAQAVVDYVAAAAHSWGEAGGGPLPEAMPRLLLLQLRVLRRARATELRLSVLARALRACAAEHALAVPAAVLCGLYSDHRYENVSLVRCTDEDMRLQCALALLELPDDVQCPAEHVMFALETIFSKSDMEPAVLSAAVLELDKLLLRNCELDEERVGAIIQKMVSRSQRIDKRNKHDRILHWDIAMFMGRHGKQYESSKKYPSERSSSDNMLIYSLGSCLTLDLPHDSGALKVNLQGVLQSALLDEDVPALSALLAALCARLAISKEESLQAALVRVLLSLSHCGVEAGVLRSAVSLCDGGCANQLIRYIALENCSQSRRLLLEAVEVLLQKDDGQVLENILEYIVPNENEASNQPNKDITDFLLKQLKDNNSMCQKYLPKILRSILKDISCNSDVLNTATDMFLDKIAMFSADTVKHVIEDVFTILNSNSESNINSKNVARVDIAVGFVKKVWDSRKGDLAVTEANLCDYFLKIVDNDCVNFRLFVAMKRTFELELEQVRRLLKRNKHYNAAEDQMEHYDTELRIDLYNEFSEIWSDVDRKGIFLRETLSPTKLTPHTVIDLRGNLTKCLRKCPNPTETTTEWVEAQPLQEITISIEKYNFESDHSVIVEALKNFLNAQPDFRKWEHSNFGGYKHQIKRWASWILKLYVSGYVERNLEAKMAFLLDLVEVSVKFYSDEEFLQLLKEGDSSDCIRFCRTFMSAIFERLVAKPYVLARPGAQGRRVLLTDVARYAFRRNRGDDVVELVTELWPTYEMETTVNQKLSLLLDAPILLSKLAPTSPLAQWTVTALSTDDISLEDKIKLFKILPDNEEYSAVQRALCGALPPRPEELRGQAALFQALLDTLAARRDALLPVLLTRAAVDSTPGWWDEAMESCMSSVAGDALVARAVYARCFEGRSLGVCTRLMIPLLRYSTPSFCEEFFSTVLEDLLSMISRKPREMSANYAYEKCLLDYVRALRMLQLVFEKVPREHIESPRSVLYSRLPAVRESLSYAVSATCKLCYSLRSAVRLAEDADDGLRESYRLFHCANYNCLASAVCCSQLKPAVCAVLFHPGAWDTLIGDQDITLPLRARWNQRTTRQAVSVELAGELRARTHSTQSTARTQAFLRTLSEDPHHFDLLQEEEQPQLQELQLADTALNRHECAATLAALLGRVSAVESAQWRDTLADTLRGGARRNVKWMLAQAVCNSKEDLKVHSGTLRPALLAALVDTTTHGQLNGLHVDILNTLVFWSDGSPQPSPLLDTAVQHVVTTALSHIHNKSIFDTMLDTLAQTLEPSVTIAWANFGKHLADLHSKPAQCCLKILLRVVKAGVHIPELLPALSALLEERRAVADVAALFTLAVKTAKDRAGGQDEWLSRYRRLLDRLRRSDREQYVALLHSAQRVLPDCCDDAHFRAIADLTPKISGRPKLKCLEILSTYVLNAPRPSTATTMLDALGLPEMSSIQEALVLMRNGLHLMEEPLRQAVVRAVAGAVHHSPARVRRVAYGVLVRALQLLTSPETTEPQSKRRARESNSLLLTSDDPYVRGVLDAVAQGLLDKDQEIASVVRDGAGKCLSGDLDVRFCESVLLCIILPASRQGGLRALLELFLQGTRASDVFRRARLSEEPLQARQTVSPSSSTSTLTRGSLLHTKQGAEPSSAGVDVQMSLEAVLTSLLQYAEKSPEAAMSLVVQLLKAHRGKRPGFDSGAVLSAHVTSSLHNIGCTTPWLLQMAREIDIWDTADLGEILERLVEKTRDTEGEDLCRLLVEDYRLRKGGPDQFVMGKVLYHDDLMSEPPTTFSMEELVSCFGKLSSWDNLTSWERSSLGSSLPPLWTDPDHFSGCVQNYQFEDSPLWLQATAATLRGTGGRSLSWLRELDQWPRRQFDIAAVMETRLWARIRRGAAGRAALSPGAQHAHCPARSAALLQMRSLFLRSLEEGASEHAGRLSRSSALAWCANANERGLHEQALAACRSVTGLYESESLRWLRQKLTAQRALALRRRERGALRSALQAAEKYIVQFREQSTYEDILGMKDIILRLKRDSRAPNLDPTPDVADIAARLSASVMVPLTTKRVAESILLNSICFYNELWETRDADQEAVLCWMSKVVEVFVNLELGPSRSLLADMVIARLDEAGPQLGGAAAEAVLSWLSLMHKELDDISLEQLHASLDKFPEELRRRVLTLTDQAASDQHRRRLGLLADPVHLLQQYCRRLDYAIEKGDPSRGPIHAAMMDALFGEEAGPDYLVLLKHRPALSSIADGTLSDSECRAVLLRVQRALRPEPRAALRLSQLSPGLARVRERDAALARLLRLRSGVHVARFEEEVGIPEPRAALRLSQLSPGLARVRERDAALARLLRLRSGVHVARFEEEEEVTVFVDALRRPALARCRLSDGSAARLLVKSGEGARAHALAVRLLPGARAALGGAAGAHYHVTRLREDCALIQYLEHHERVKAMVASDEVNAAVGGVRRANNSELILAPTAALQQFQEICGKVPPYLLRSAIESTCASLQDFILKRRNFLESLCDMTLLSYLYGIGDRHLENILYGLQRGAVCQVDCGAVLRYGSAELPPARLTRSLLAVCDYTVLESRLQRSLSALRGALRLLLPAVTLAFRWSQDSDLISKLQHVRSLLQGSTTSYHLAAQCLRESGLPYSQRYIQLLEEVFADMELKQTYSVEEQVTSLLRHSTDPRILSVTRAEWEPWL